MLKSGRVLIKVIVASFPILLIGMVIVGALLYEKRRTDKTEENPIARSVTVKNLVANYIKLRDFMHPRGFSNQGEVQNLTRTAAFIDGSIATINTGMRVESDLSLTEAGKLWKYYQIKFGEKETTNTLSINYLKASNAELSVAIMISEALPQKDLQEGLIITFSPSGDSSPLISKWVAAAKEAGAENSLNEDGYDWNYLQSEILTYIENL